MAYQKRYTKKRTSKKRKGVASTYFKGTAFQKYADMAYKGFRIATRVAGMVNVEYKVAQATATSTASTTGLIVLMNGLTKGDDYNNRDGRQVRWKSIQLNTNLQKSASSTDTIVRRLIFIDKQPTGAQPAVTDLLDNSAALNLAFRNLSFRKRFVILSDKTILLNTDYPEKVDRFYKRIDLRTIYDDSDAGTIADINTNALYVYYVSDEATNTPAIIYNYRLRFIDN